MVKLAIVMSKSLPSKKQMTVLKYVIKKTNSFIRTDITNFAMFEFRDTIMKFNLRK